MGENCDQIVTVCGLTYYEEQWQRSEVRILSESRDTRDPLTGPFGGIATGYDIYENHSIVILK